MNHIEATLARKDDATSIALRAALTAARAKVTKASMGYGWAASVAFAGATDTPALAFAKATAAEETVTRAYVAYVTFGQAPPAALLAGRSRLALKGALKGAARRRTARWHAAVRFDSAPTLAY